MSDVDRWTGGGLAHDDATIVLVGPPEGTLAGTAEPAVRLAGRLVGERELARRGRGGTRRRRPQAGGPGADRRRDRRPFGNVIGFTVLLTSTLLPPRLRAVGPAARAALVALALFSGAIAGTALVFYLFPCSSCVTCARRSPSAPSTPCWRWWSGSSCTSTRRCAGASPSRCARSRRSACARRSSGSRRRAPSWRPFRPASTRTSSSTP